MTFKQIKQVNGFLNCSHFTFLIFVVLGDISAKTPNFVFLIAAAMFDGKDYQEVVQSSNVDVDAEADVGVKQEGM